MRYIPNTSMSESDQFLHRLANAGVRIRHHKRNRFNPLYTSIHKDQRQISRDQRFHTRGVRSLRNHNRTINTLPQQVLDECILSFYGFRRRANECRKSMCIQALFHRRDQLGKICVAQIRHQQTNCFGSGRTHRSRADRKHSPFPQLFSSIIDESRWRNGLYRENQRRQQLTPACWATSFNVTNAISSHSCAAYCSVRNAQFKCTLLITDARKVVSCVKLFYCRHF